MIQKLTNYASIIGVIGAIGGGFYAWGEFNTRLDAIENKDFVVNEQVDLTPINEKISELEVEILDRMSALEDEWKQQDNESLDPVKNTIAGIENDIGEIYKEFGKEFSKVRELLGDLNKKIAIAEKQSELNGILIEEIKEETSNPLGG